MAFLESNKYVHRDVAARNCLGKCLTMHKPNNMLHSYMHSWTEFRSKGSRFWDG